VLRVAKAVELAGAIALIGLSLLATVAEAQVPLKPELELAAEVQALAQACRELQPELAEHVDTTVNNWWERNAEAADAVHVLYFGAPSPERSAQQWAFEKLQQRFATEAEHSRTVDPDAFAERCRLFLDRLESELRPDRLELGAPPSTTT
jgi:hypothetical protein